MQNGKGILELFFCSTSNLQKSFPSCMAFFIQHPCKVGHHHFLDGTLRLTGNYLHKIPWWALLDLPQALPVKWHVGGINPFLCWEVTNKAVWCRVRENSHFFKAAPVFHCAQDVWDKTRTLIRFNSQVGSHVLVPHDELSLQCEGGGFWDHEVASFNYQGGKIARYPGEWMAGE